VRVATRVTFPTKRGLMGNRHSCLCGNSEQEKEEEHLSKLEQERKRIEQKQDVIKKKRKVLRRHI